MLDSYASFFIAANRLNPAYRPLPIPHADYDGYHHYHRPNPDERDKCLSQLIFL